MRRSTAILLLLTTLLASCRRDRVEESPQHRAAREVVVSWNKILLDLERYTPGYRPPVSARMFAYMGMAAYEAALPAMVTDHISVADYCPGYVAPPMPARADFDLPGSLNAAYAQCARHFFSTAPQHMQLKMSQLEAEFAQRESSEAIGPEMRALSVAYGRSVADAVWQWSRTDSLGNDANLYNYDRAYQAPQCPGCWQPDEMHSTPALTPHWGKVRQFWIARNDIKVQPPAPYDTSPGSAFYTEAMEVFTVSQPLSRENRWIAEFWSDDVPGLTVTPVGRWISITNQAVAQSEPPFPKVIELYLRIGWAMHDAGVVCWRGKYLYNLERPQTYISRCIQPGWKPLHDNPSFPSYPSGHSAFGAAAAEILGACLGNEYELTDRTHIDRKEFAGTPRTFRSFAEMARENAFSRVALGVHYRMDCEEGLRVGHLVGQSLLRMELTRTAVRL